MTILAKRVLMKGFQKAYMRFAAQTTISLSPRQITMRFFRRWQLVLLLSTIIAIGLFAAFLVSLETQKPIAVKENIVLNAAKLEMVRPDSACIAARPNTNVSSSYEKDVNLTQGIDVTFYATDFLDGSDTVELAVNTTAKVETGYIINVNITFWEDYKNSEVDVDRIPWPGNETHLENLTVVRHGPPSSVNGLKNFVELTNTNQSKNVHADGYVNWLLNSPQNNTHDLEIDVETTYYNGTTFKRVVQPFRLNIGPDNNNALETATEIHQGNYSGVYLGPYDGVDYYKIYTDEGEKIKIQINAYADNPLVFNVLIWDQEAKTILQTKDPTQEYSIEFTSNYTGNWYVKVQEAFGNTWGFYQMQIGR